MHSLLTIFNSGFLFHFSLVLKRTPPSDDITASRQKEVSVPKDPFFQQQQA